MKKIGVLCAILILACAGIQVKAADTLADGSYQIEAELSGGSGRASVESPMKLVIAGQNMTATVIWSSPYFDYMMVGDTKYEPVNEKGNSEFEIPINDLSEELEFSAETIAMSEPHVIEYTLKFDEKTLEPEGTATPEDPAVPPCLIVVGIVVLAAAVIVIICARKRRTKDK